MKESKKIDRLTNSRFISCGYFTAGCLSLRQEMVEQTNPIFEIHDDFSMGPLENVDRADISQRLSWWNSVWSANHWCYGNTKEHESIKSERLNKYTLYQKDLLTALASTEPIVIWVGNNANNKLMLAMVASLTQAEISIIDIAEQSPKRYNWQGHYTIEMCPTAVLSQLKPKPLSDNARTKLQQQWKYWQQHGRGWRATDINGNVIEYPLDYLDKHLLKKIAELDTSKASRIIGELLTEYSLYVTECFLLWRLDILQQLGHIALIKTASPKINSYPDILIKTI